MDKRIRNELVDMIDRTLGEEPNPALIAARQLKAEIELLDEALRTSEEDIDLRLLMWMLRCCFCLAAHNCFYLMQSSSELFSGPSTAKLIKFAAV